MQYIYIGKGIGVPGLPHEISDEEARAQGLESLLVDALANGSYEPVPAVSTATAPRFSKSKSGNHEPKE